MSGKGAESSREEKHLGEEWRKEYTGGWIFPWEPSRTSSLLRTAVEAQSSIFLTRAICVSAGIRSLRTAACCPTIEAFVTRPIPNHQRTAFRARRRLFLQPEWKALFRG